MNDSERRLLSIAFGKEPSELTGDDVSAIDGVLMHKTYSDDRDHKLYYPQLLTLARHGE